MTATLLLSCVLAGAGAAHSSPAVRPVVDSDLAAAGLPQAPASHQSMAPSRAPVKVHLACLVLPPLLKPDTSGNRLKWQPVTRISTSVNSAPDYHYLECTSTSLVSASLGQRLTLVGAKPSGTS
ncbi:MAG: hypothetical protein AB1744_07010 [Candidatus Zixiibacteriota bacterium]